VCSSDLAVAPAGPAAIDAAWAAGDWLETSNGLTGD